MKYLTLSLLFFLFSFLPSALRAQSEVEFRQLDWPSQGMLLEVPVFLEKTYVQKDEWGGVGGGLKLELMHTGKMDVREELAFFEGILVFTIQEPTDIWEADFPARLISGLYEGTRIWLLAFNNKAGESYAAIAYFDEDDAGMEQNVRRIFHSIRWKSDQ